mgnify:CR=1 FL=1
MAEIRIPYSKSSVTARVPEHRLAGVLVPKSDSAACPTQSVDAQSRCIQAALEQPLGSPRLCDLAANCRHATVITSDHTRPVPSRITLPLLLAELRRHNPDIAITILVATGMHRPTTKQELQEKVGHSIVEHETIVTHNSQDTESLVRLQTLPSGGELWLNRLAVETDLLVAEGFIEPHFFAGFSGGRKSVLPGVAGYRTVLANHCARFIADSRARTGILDGNPIHNDMIFAARQAQLAFILNVALDEEKRVLYAVAGDCDTAHRRGCDFVAHRSAVRRLDNADIVITSNGGYPLDQNIYQSVKGMTAAEATCRPGGVIIMVAGCENGHGGDSFYRHLAESSSPGELLERVSTVPMDKTVPDQWEFQILARILTRYKVILVTELCDPGIITAMHMDWAPTVDAALRLADACAGPNAAIAVIPDGVGVIVQ